jgi:hypothetical protein
MMKAAAIATCLLLLATAPTFAQSSEPAAPSLRLPLIVCASAAAVDFHSTYTFLQYEGLQEANPLTNWLDQRPKTMIAVGAAMEAGALYGLHRWLGKKHPTFSRVALYAASGVHLSAAFLNYQSVRTHRRLTADERGVWAGYRK